MSFDDIADTTEAHQRRITRCRSCRARIIFLDSGSGNGKAVPVDADTVEPEDMQFAWGRHVAHFSTCPQANDWRRRR